jgi:hypothetical protein
MQKNLKQVPHAVNFWTGYYSNKPVLKTQIKELMKKMKTTSQFQSYIAI